MSAKVTPAFLEATKNGKTSQKVLETEAHRLLAVLTVIPSSMRRDPKANTAKKDTNQMQRNFIFFSHCN